MKHLDFFGLIHEKIIIDSLGYLFVSCTAKAYSSISSKSYFSAISL